MPWRSLRALLIAALPALPALSAQAPELHPPRDPAWYQGIESQTLYFVRGADTTRMTGTAPRIARLVWVPSPHGDALVVTTTALDVHRVVTTDTLRLDQHGNVVAVAPDSASVRDRYALFLRLPVPPGALDSGATWGDTLAPGWPAPGTRSLSAHITGYRIVGATDTLGTSATVVVVDGVARYRQSDWFDASSKTTYQVDATGPMHETWWLDPKRGELLARRRELELTGVGVVPAEKGADTIPVGVSADDAWGRITPERAQVLARPLPGRDSSLTVTTGPILLHTVNAVGQAIESGLAANDGSVGTALSVTAGATPVQYQTLWTAPGAKDTTALVAVHGDSLYVTGTRMHNWPVPPMPWAIADEGMEEQLVPVLHTLADSQSVVLPVFRPRTATWDTLNAFARYLPGGARLFVLAHGAPDTRVAILVDSTGALLTVEKATDPPSRRLPPAGSTRRIQLDQLFKLLGAPD
ncbi:MAG: hypothetical protein ACREL4_01930 [Gemmatimonadales bacterium]